MPNVTGSMALLWSNFLKIRANQFGVGTYVITNNHLHANSIFSVLGLTIFMQIQSFPYWVCAEQRSPRTLQSHDEQTTSKNVNLWVATLLASGKGEHISTNKYYIETTPGTMEDSFRCLCVCVPIFVQCVPDVQCLFGCIIQLRIHPPMIQLIPTVECVDQPCTPDMLAPLMTNDQTCPHRKPWVSVRILATICCEKGGGITCKNLAVLAQVEEGFVMVCPKKQQKLALQTKRLKLFNEGYNVIPPLSQESLVAIESMRRTLHFCWAL